MDASVTSLADDVREWQLEKPVPKAIKSAEELEQLTVDEHLSDIERAVYLLSSGQEVQRVSVIYNLPDLLQQHHTECMRRVVPKVKEVLHVAEPDVQFAAKTAFLEILQQELIPIQNYAQTFLQNILVCIESKDPEIADAWLETLLDVIDLLPKDIIKNEILSIAVAKGELSQSVHARLACCRILGKIATKFEPFIIKKEILPVVQSLCQDIEYEVRGCMCRQLDSVARGLGLEATKGAIIPELVELTNDEECSVRVAGLETVVSILSLLDEETCTHTIIPLVVKLSQQSLQQQDATMPVVAKQLGKLCHGLRGHLTDEQKQWFIDCYQRLCRVGLSLVCSQVKITYEADIIQSPAKITDVLDIFDEDRLLVESRINVAYNFPGMALFTGPKSFRTEMYPSFTSLCHDPHILVRSTISQGFHEVARLLTTTELMILPDLTSLLKDDSIEVLRGVITHLPDTLDFLFKGSVNSETESSLLDIIAALLSAEKVIFASNDWRLQEELMKNLACMAKFSNSEPIYQKVIPLVYKKVQCARALPVRHASAKTLLILNRQNRKMESREEIYKRLVEDFCYGRSCHQRGLFIDICKFVFDLFSKLFFKEHFFEPVLELANDAVPNIRLRICTILTELKRMVKLPSDRILLQALDMAIRRLLVNDKDRDVNEAVKKAVEELDRIHVQMETLSKRLMLFEDDLADQKKEDEERKLIEMEEKEKEEENKSASKTDKKKQELNIVKKDELSTSKIPSPARRKTSLGAHPSGSREKMPSAGTSRDARRTSSNSSTSSQSGAKSTHKPPIPVFLLPSHMTVSLSRQRPGTPIPPVPSSLSKSKSASSLSSQIPRFESVNKNKSSIPQSSSQPSLIASPHIPRRASTEQLAIAVPRPCRLPSVIGAPSAVTRKPPHKPVTAGCKSTAFGLPSSLIQASSVKNSKLTRRSVTPPISPKLLVRTRALASSASGRTSIGSSSKVTGESMIPSSTRKMSLMEKAGVGTTPIRRSSVCSTGSNDSASSSDSGKGSKGSAMSYQRKGRKSSVIKP